MLKLKRLISFILVASISFTAGLFIQSRLDTQDIDVSPIINPEVPSQVTFENNQKYSLPPTLIDALDELWVTIELEGLWPIDHEKAKSNLLSALSQSMEDPYSEWLSYETLQSLENQINNAYEGMGFDLIDYSTEHAKTLIIGNILKNSAAYASELKVGDQLIAVNGVNLMGQMDLFKTAKSIKTNPIQLEVKRGEEIIPVELEPMPYQEPLLSHYPLDDDIYYIDLNTFSDNLAEELYTVLSTLKSNTYKSIIFDVRYNFGGYMGASYDVLSMLLSTDLLGYIVTKDSTEPIARTQTQVLNLNYGVLINRETYSAAEFFAQSLNTYADALLIGETTHGKGTMQGLYTAEEGTLKLSHAYFSATSDSYFEGIGITPTHPIDLYSDFTGGDKAVSYAYTLVKKGFVD